MKISAKYSVTGSSAGSTKYFHHRPSSDKHQLSGSFVYCPGIGIQSRIWDMSGMVVASKTGTVERKRYLNVGNVFK